MSAEKGRWKGDGKGDEEAVIGNHEALNGDGKALKSMERS